MLARGRELEDAGVLAVDEERVRAAVGRPLAAVDRVGANGSAPVPSAGPERVLTEGLLAGVPATTTLRGCDDSIMWGSIPV